MHVVCSVVCLFVCTLSARMCGEIVSVLVSGSSKRDSDDIWATHTYPRGRCRSMEHYCD